MSRVCVGAQILDHYPCPWSPTNDNGAQKLGSWDRKIEFPNNKQAKVQKDPKNGNCYQIGGRVKMYGEMRGNIHMLVGRMGL
jgi:hypothetical protein